MRDWLESEVKAAEERWDEADYDPGRTPYLRAYWDAMATALDTFEAISEGKQ